MKPRSRAFLHTATLILAGAIFASGVSSAVATDGAVRDLTRIGLVEIIIQKLAN